MARILVVEDDKSIRDLLKDVLVSQGHEVELAEDGRIAVQLVRKNAYQLMILDRNMPFMTGLEALQLIRADAKNRKLKVLMCTSASVVKEVDEAFEAGADDYLIKPLNLKAVIEKVQALLK